METRDHSVLVPQTFWGPILVRQFKIHPWQFSDLNVLKTFAFSNVFSVKTHRENEHRKNIIILSDFEMGNIHQKQMEHLSY